MMYHQPLPASQRGAVLITSLIFLVMLTVVAVVANQSTVLETRMSTNAIVKARAVESSEALRTLSHELIASACHSHGWPDSITGLTGGTVREDEFHIPTGVDVNTPVDWCTENPLGEQLLDSTTWQKDLTLLVDSNTDSDYVDDGDQQAEFYAHRISSTRNPGSATAMVAGYEGLGKSTASGGGAVLLDLRSVGRSAGNSSGVTGSIYRQVLR